MVKRRRAVLAALSALLVSAGRAVALGPTITPQVSQCDGTYQSGTFTHAPASQVHIQAAVQSATGLRMTPGGTRMGTGGNGNTNALWRFDDDTSNVDVTLSCAVNFFSCPNHGRCATFEYKYTDSNGSDPMIIGDCVYDSDCTSTFTVVNALSRAPLGGSCPATPFTGNTTWFPADGHFAYAGNARADFDGSSQYGSVTYANGFWDLPASYTLSAWIKVPAGGTGLRRIVSEQGPAGYWGLSLGGAGQLREFDSRDNGGATDNTMGPSLNDNNWHKVDVVRVNGSYKRFYVDGQSVGTISPVKSTTSFTNNPISHPVMIGEYETGSERFLGSINEIRVLFQTLTDDQILLEYQGSIHKYSSNGGVTFSNATGGYVIGTSTDPPSLQDGYTGVARYIPGETYTSSAQQWLFLAQDMDTVSNILATPYTISIDQSAPISGSMSGSPISTTQIAWTWTAPTRDCVSPGTGVLGPGYVNGPYAQLFDCGSGAATVSPGLVQESARAITESYGATPNQFACRRLAITDVWGRSPLTTPASNYTNAAPPTGLAFSSVSSGSFVATWGGNGNPAYTRFEVGYSQDPLFGAGVSTRVAMADNFTGTTVGSSGLASGATYYVRVRAFSGAGTNFFGGVPTSYVSGHFSTVPPGPTLTATANSNSQITWTWTSAPGAVSYTLYDSSTGAVLDGPAAVLAFPEFGLNPNTRYDGEVEAEMPSPTPASPRGHAFAYTFANPAVSPAVSAVFMSSASVTWGANGNPSYTFYQLVYSTDSSFAVGVATLSVAATTATPTGLLPGATYFAKVQAVSGGQVGTSFTSTLQFATARDPLITISSSPASPYVPVSGLVGAWQFDEGAGTSTADGSGLGHAGALACQLSVPCFSTPTFSGGPAGLGDAALFSGLDGGAVIAAGNPPIGTGDLTIEAWVDPATAAQKARATVAAVGPTNTEEFALDVSPTFRFLTSNSGTEYAATVATATLVPGQWIHLAGVYQKAAGVSTLYVNGVPTAVRTGVPPRPGTSNALWIGNRQSSNGLLAFAGGVDSVRLFNVALTAAQVRADYAGSFISTVAAPSPNSGVLVGLPPNAFSAPATVYISRDPSGHPIRVSATALSAGLAALPPGLTMVPNSLVEVVPVVNGTPYTVPLGSSATLTIPFTDANRDNLIDGTNPPLAASGVRMYTLNTTVNRWELLPTTVDSSGARATGVTPHFSVFALFAPATVASGLMSVKVYPVPWKPGSGGRFDAAGVTFANLPAAGTIRILTLAGQRVRDFAFDGSGAGFAVWDGRNDDGRRAASGVYFARVKNAADNATVLLKFAVER